MEKKEMKWVSRVAVASLGWTAFVTGGALEAQPVFETFRNIDLGVDSGRSLVSDLNGDGNMDLISSLDFSEEVSVRMGRPGGEFDALQVFSVGEQPNRIEAGDLDEDGNPDLVVLCLRNLHVLRADGSGSFSPGPSIPLSIISGFTSLVLGDIDVDGHLDAVLAFQGRDSRIQVYRGDGTGTLSLHREHELSEPFNRVVLGDFRTDGNPDLLLIDGLRSTSGHSFQQVILLAGEGTGDFSEETVALPEPAVDVKVGDFDEDGSEDLAAVNRAGGVTFLKGAPTGSFAPGGTSVARTPFQLLRVVDFNGDGTLDLMSQSRVLIGNGRGRFSNPRYEFSVDGLIDYRLIDLNGDGAIDVLGSVGGSAVIPTGLRILYGNGAGGFTVPDRQDPTDLGLPPHAFVEPFDFNADGRVDLMSKNGSDLDLVRGDGDGEFTLLSPVATPFDLPRSILVPGDFDADGNPDLAVVQDQQLGHHLPNPGQIDLLQGDGTGGFAPSPTSTVLSRFPKKAVSGDLDGDGFDDLVISFGPRDSTQELSLFKRQAQGGFSSIATFGVGDPVALIRLEQMDGNPSVDVVALRSVQSGPNSGQFSVTIHLDDGQGGFSDLAPLQLGTGVNDVAVHDWNEDGLPDLLVCKNAGRSFAQENGVRIYLGQALGGFQDAGLLATAFRTRRVLITDADQDGKRDLVALAGSGLSADSGIATVLSGDGQGNVISRRDFGLGNDGAFELVLEDVDGDGDQDLVGLHPGVVVVRNRTHDAITARAGRVGGAASPVDVLRVNGSAGEGERRIVRLGVGDNALITMDVPPGAGATADFVAYAWRGEPTPFTVRNLANGLGRTAMPFPLTDRAVRLLRVWNTTDRVSPRFGEPAKRIDPAPSTLAEGEVVPGYQGTFFIQGMIQDPAAAGTTPSVNVTNGVLVLVE